MSESTPHVSIIIVNTNELHHLRRCLPSVVAQTYRSFEVVIVDNASTDGSLEFTRTQFPFVRVVPSGGNLGYTGANNLGFRATTGEYCAVLNPDTEVAPGWLDGLVRALEANPAAGLATSKILLMDEPTKINACGNVISVAGLTFCRGFGRPASEFSAVEVVPAVSGAAFLIRRTVLDEIGPFDENFFTYLEETDLSLRAKLAGYSCLYVPDSVVYHKYSFRFSERKCFDIEKNRYFMLLKTFRLRSLVSMLPALIFADFLVWAYMLRRGPRFVRQKWRSYGWLLRNRAIIRSGRQRAQCTRRVSDAELYREMVSRLQYEQMVEPRLARLLDAATTPIMSMCSRAALLLMR